MRAAAADFCHERAGNDSPKALGGWEDARATFQKLPFYLFFHFCFRPPTILTDTTSRPPSVSPGSSHGFWVAFWNVCYPLISWAFPCLGEGTGSPDNSASCLAGLGLTLAPEPGLSRASCSGLNAAESNPAPPWFRWLHRPGFGLLFPVWASGP